jgi:hypothetical protein
VVDRVEGPGQIRVQDPSTLAAIAAQRLEDDLDRVMAAPTRPKPVGSRLEPGLPLGLQRVLHARLLRAIGDHWYPERALLAACLGDVHPLDGTGSPEGTVAMQARCQRRPIPGRQCDLPVDTRRLAASVALRNLPHAHQRVAVASQHQPLQVADPFEVPLPRRLEDPLP